MSGKGRRKTEIRKIGTRNILWTSQGNQRACGKAHVVVSGSKGKKSEDGWRWVTALITQATSTSVSNHQATRRKTPEDRSSQNLWWRWSFGVPRRVMHWQKTDVSENTLPPLSGQNYLLPNAHHFCPDDEGSMQPKDYTEQEPVTPLSIVISPWKPQNRPTCFDPKFFPPH